MREPVEWMQFERFKKHASANKFQIELQKSYDYFLLKITRLALFGSFGYQPTAAPDWFLYISIVYWPITVLHSLRNVHYISFLPYVSSFFSTVFSLLKTVQLLANQIKEMF